MKILKNGRIKIKRKIKPLKKESEKVKIIIKTKECIYVFIGIITVFLCSFLYAQDSVSHTNCPIKRWNYGITIFSFLIPKTIQFPGISVNKSFYQLGYEIDVDGIYKINKFTQGSFSLGLADYRYKFNGYQEINNPKFYNYKINYNELVFSAMLQFKQKVKYKNITLCERFGAQNSSTISVHIQYEEIATNGIDTYNNRRNKEFSDIMEVFYSYSGFDNTVSFQAGIGLIFTYHGINIPLFVNYLRKNEAKYGFNYTNGNYWGISCGIII